MNITENRQKFRPCPRLQMGDKVAVVAPSSAFDREAFQRGLERLQSRYQVVFSEDIFGRERFFSGDDATRLQDLKNALFDDEIRAIFCARGGYGAMRLLPDLAWPKVPKLLVGFSDITALHLALQTHGWCSVHGPVVTQLGRLPWDDVNALFEALENPQTSMTHRGTEGFGGTCAGPVLGGNLSVLTQLLGTPFFPDVTGAILLLEDVGERPYALDRMMIHLALAGVFRRVAGVALGEFTNCDDGEKLSGAEVVQQFIRDHHLPCVTGLFVGHGARNLPVPLGAWGLLHGDDATLTMKDGCVV